MNDRLTVRRITGALGAEVSGIDVCEELDAQAGLDGFHAAFLALAVIAALGAVNSSVRFPRHHLERIDA